MKISGRFEVISRSVKTSSGELVQHSLALLHRPLPACPEPWWTYPAGLEYQVPHNFQAEPGDIVTISIECQ